MASNNILNCCNIATYIVSIANTWAFGHVVCGPAPQIISFAGM